MHHHRSSPQLVLSKTDALLMGVMAALLRGYLSAALAGSIVALLFAVQHASIIFFTLLHRPSNTAPTSRTATMLAWLGTLLPLAMRPTGSSLIPPLGPSLFAIGSVLATGAIISLGRSFGLEPAHRGLQTRLFYRVVRHPIYAAYLLIVGGFLLTYTTWANGVIAFIWLLIQIARIRYEEALLRQDEQYQLYTQSVRYRLVPGVW